MNNKEPIIKENKERRSSQWFEKIGTILEWIIGIIIIGLIKWSCRNS